MTQEIPLTQGKSATVDASDYERLARHKWYAARSGKRWCAARMKDQNTTVWMHRTFYDGLRPSEVIHHINGDALDNRRRNLCRMTISAHKKTHAMMGRTYALTDAGIAAITEEAQ